MMTNFHSHAFTTRAVIRLTLISVLVLPAIFLFPFHSDIDNYHSMGFRLYQTHGLPYLDSFVANFPGMSLLHEFVIMLFGKTVFGFRLFELFWQSLTLFALYGVLRFWLSEASALLACLLFALYYVCGPVQFLGQPDGFAVLPLVLAPLAMILAYREKRASFRNSFLITAGVLYASATLIRPTFALMLFLPMLFLFDPRVRSFRVCYAFTTLGFLALVLVVLLFLGLHDGLHEAYLDTIKYNFEVYGPAFNLRNMSDRTWIFLAFIVGWGIVMLIDRRRGRSHAEFPQSRSERRFLVASFCSLIFGIIFMRRFAGYHLIPLFAYCISAFAAFFLEWKSQHGRKGTVMICALLLCSVAVLYPWRRLVTVLTVPTPVQPFSERWYSDSETDAMVSYVMQHTDPMDTIDVTSHSSDQWRIDRVSATRFATVECLTITRPDGTFSADQQSWQREYVHDLHYAKYYVVQYLADPTGTSLDILFRIPGMKALLSDNYRLDTTFGRYWVYKRI